MAGGLSNSIISDNHGDQRCEPRVGYRLLLSINGVEIPTANISISGAQACCPSMRYQSLSANKEQPISVSWMVPESSVEISCLASLRYVNFCEDEYLLGLKFSGFGEDAFKCWKNFVSSLITKRDGVRK